MEAVGMVLGRRRALKFGLAGMVGSELARLEQLALAPGRGALGASGGLPSIQYDIGRFIAPAFSLGGVRFQFGPVYTLFVPARLKRSPGRRDQDALRRALDT